MPAIAPIGPLTNIALLLRLYPHLASKISHLCLMGGSIGLGNVTPAAECNIWADPEAAARVFESGLEWAERYGHRPTDPTVPLERDGDGSDGDRDGTSQDDLASPG